MKSVKLKAILTSAAFAGLMMSGSALAADNVTVTVNATIVGVCKFFTASPVLNINNTGGPGSSSIDPSSTTDATGNAAITYRCSNGTSPNFVVPATATVTCGTCSGTPTMLPTITSSNTGAGTGLGTGKDQTLTVTGTILVANFQNAPAGPYTGSMSVTVTP